MNTTFTPAPAPLREPAAIPARGLDRLATISRASLSRPLVRPGYRQPVLTGRREAQDVVAHCLPQHGQDNLAGCAAPADVDHRIGEPIDCDDAGRGQRQTP